MSKSLLKMAIEIVDLPSYKMVIFYSYVSLPEGTIRVLIVMSQLAYRGKNMKTCCMVHTFLWDKKAVCCGFSPVSIGESSK